MACTPAYWTNKKCRPSVQAVSQLSLSQAPHSFGAPYHGFPLSYRPQIAYKKPPSYAGYTPKELFINNREIIDGNIQLGATFLTENWIYRYTVLKQNPLPFATCDRSMLLLSSGLFTKFYTARESNDCQTFDWRNSIKFKASLYQTLDVLVSNSKQMGDQCLCYDFADRKRLLK